MNISHRWVRLLTALCAVALVSACAATSQVKTAPTHADNRYLAARIIAGDEQASDVSAALGAAFQRHGLKSRINSASSGHDELIVRFKDSWKRDGLTYLDRLSIELIDAQSQSVVASAQWQNAALHDFHSVPEVVDVLVDKTFAKLRWQRPQPVAAASQSANLQR
jgi:hypothetical protein